MSNNPKKKNEALENAIAAVTATTSPKTPPVDNDHVAAGAEKFSEETVKFNAGQAKPETTGKREAPNAATAFATPKTTSKGQAWRLKVRGNLYNVFDFTAQRGQTLEDIKRPGYWADIAKQFRPGDEIVVMCEDLSWEAKLRVLGADKQWAKVGVIAFHNWTHANEDTPKTQEEEYEIAWTVVGKYAVIKKDLRGQPPLKDGFQSKRDAYIWLDDHLKTLNG